jgi:hypothetical protein
MGPRGLSTHRHTLLRVQSGTSSVKSLEDSTPRAIQEPHFDGPPVLHEKGETYATKATPELATEEELDAIDN